VDHVQAVSFIDGRLLLNTEKAVYSVNFEQAHKFSVVVIPENNKQDVYEKIITPGKHKPLLFVIFSDELKSMCPLHENPLNRNIYESNTQRLSVLFDANGTSSHKRLKIPDFTLFQSPTFVLMRGKFGEHSTGNRFDIFLNIKFFPKKKFVEHVLWYLNRKIILGAGNLPTLLGNCT
jgi:hypothetical protein